MSMFGSATGTVSQPQQQQVGGLFGGSSANAGNQNQQSGGGLFGAQNGQLTNNLFGGATQNQQTGGNNIFGAPNTQATQGGGVFGQGSQNNQSQGNGLFGSTLGQSQVKPQSSLFGGSMQQQQQQQPQQQQSGGLFSQSAQPQQNLGQSQRLGQLAAPSWIPGSGINPREKSVSEQISLVLEKWNPSTTNCVFKYYFYNKVGEDMAPYYRPTPQDDPKAWEEALSKKPGPGYIPVLCTGFQQMGDRIKIQQRFIGSYNQRLHEISDALTRILHIHDTNTSIRIMDAKRKHVVLKNRCLALATKVQILRNRGYALGGDEEDLQRKLHALEASVCDPSLGARAEEIWARMISVQERARLLQHELERSGTESQNLLDEDLTKRAKKILEDYQTQLIHLKKEMEAIQVDYTEWEKEQGPPAKKAAVR
ncbi:nucleoporin nup44 [Phlyctema vagabunda]|uniref:Nucleoporin nup44 n=1 Tax=Phlyctema vagabunda TaxID=108571 RepID=A0ABR4P6M7_9HELO